MNPNFIFYVYFVENIKFIPKYITIHFYCTHDSLLKEVWYYSVGIYLKYINLSIYGKKNTKA